MAKSGVKRSGRGTKASQATVSEQRTSLDMAAIGTSVGYRLRRAQIAIFQDIIKTFAAHDIRPAQYSVLVLIAANPGLNQSEVAAALGIKRANFVALIDGLEARDLARRLPTETDRRSYALHLTDAGQTLLRELNRLQRDHEERVIALIGEDRRADLLDMLERISGLAATLDEAEADEEAGL